VFLVLESFTPSTYLIDPAFIDEHTGLNASDERWLATDTPFYNAALSPSLRRLAATGVTFSGLASHGIPTAAGLMALLTGQLPAQASLNVQSARYAHADDLPTFMRGQGYRTLYLSSQSLEWDGLPHWINRRPAAEEAMTRLKCAGGVGDLADDPVQRALGLPKFPPCDAARVAALARKFRSIDFPRWFDFLGSYFPSEEQAVLLNLSYASLVYHDWYADRILAKQLALHWRQQRAFSPPLFVMMLDCDSHMPYKGYDRDEFYEGMPKATKEQRFKRVNRYADHYFVGEVVDFLRREDPNTIVVVTGDHGTRDVPVRSRDSPVSPRSVFSGDCVGTSSGVDAMFVVSAVVTYLGDDPAVKEALHVDALAGKTLKFATDHGDLVYTVMDVVSRLRGQSMPPSNRRSRNILDVSADLLTVAADRGVPAAVARLNASGWQALSVASYQMDYRNGSQMLRTHTADSSQAHFYSNASFPCCLKRAGAPDMRLGGPASPK
jgi:arylsulfatase A-like enzyme